MLSDLCSTRKLSMWDELPRVKEAELELTSAERNACIGLLCSIFYSGAPIIDMGVHLPMIQDIWDG